MKLKYLIVFLVTILSACHKDEIKDRGKEEHEETPELIAPSKPCSTLYMSIMDMFFEHKNNQTEYPQLFTAEAQKNIVLTHDSKVFITFISEGAGFENSLGYYTYNEKDGAPSNSGSLKLNVLFPNVSEPILKEGDMLQLGTEEFKAGTVIGFFLVIRGWEYPYVNFKKTINFTDPSYNLNGLQQHILFKEGKCADIVMAFEDKPLLGGVSGTGSPSDYDFNDVIFTISDNNKQLETVNFNLSTMVTFDNAKNPS